MKHEPPKTPLITVSPDVLSGTPVFTGTRVPVETLIEYLEGGDSIDDFLAGFPSVTREQVVAFLEEAKERMFAAAT
jgi:uncharacterized protein (DUF433 family)